ncbi:MAG: hypothetical protein IJI66_15690 [Erysipelotrichaceae bacterium]|nr:hypothetical protein [Erysipelotrichaceae bacterium]
MIASEKTLEPDPFSAKIMIGRLVSGYAEAALAAWIAFFKDPSNPIKDEKQSSSLLSFDINRYNTGLPWLFSIFPSSTSSFNNVDRLLREIPRCSESSIVE